VYGFVCQSGGSVDIDSTPGAGATVTLTFPAAATSSPPAAGCGQKASNSVGAGG